MDSVFVEYLLAIEDLGVLSEAVSRMLHEKRTDYQSGDTLGKMFQAAHPVGNLGFPVEPLDLNDRPATEAALAQAKAGDKTQMAAVVRRFRNLTAHAGPSPDWCLNPNFLSQVIEIQLDFIITIARSFDHQVGFPTATTLSSSLLPAPMPSSTVSAPSAPHLGGFLSGSVGTTK